METEIIGKNNEDVKRFFSERKTVDADYRNERKHLSGSCRGV